MGNVTGKHSDKLTFLSRRQLRTVGETYHRVLRFLSMQKVESADFSSEKGNKSVFRFKSALNNLPKALLLRQALVWSPPISTDDKVRKGAEVT